MTFWLYILRCADGSYYIGHTENLEKRFAEHNLGAVSSYTRKRRPLTLVFSEQFSTREEALTRELNSRDGRVRRRRHSSRGTGRACVNWRDTSRCPSVRPE